MSAPRDPSTPLYGVGYGSAGRCGFVLSTDPITACERPAAYLIRLRRWTPDERGGCCAEHGTVIRTYPDLEWMRSYTGAAR